MRAREVWAHIKGTLIGAALALPFALIWLPFPPAFLFIIGWGALLGFFALGTAFTIYGGRK